jgi:hypothetical protein
MNSKFRVGGLFSLLVIALLAMPAAQCRAGGPWFWGYGPFGCGYGYGLGDGYFSNQVPYFSLHPPVYYSRPMAYSFGYSPFPNPPYAPLAGDCDDGPAVQVVHSPPLRIANPYVSQTNTATNLPAVIPYSRAPKVLYPAAATAGAIAEAAGNRSGHGLEKR